jgi:epoxyqueuosine reductase
MFTSLKTSLESQGLEMFGVVSLKEEASYKYYDKWLTESKHAQMHYMEKNKHIRKQPKLLFPQADKAIIVGFSYSLDKTYHDTNAAIQVAQYARFRDYHKILKQKATKGFNLFLEKNKITNISFRVTVDSAPILEKPLASRCSKGFIGKNTLFIHPQKGSFFLLAEILTNLDLDCDKKQHVDNTKRDKTLGGCGTCKRCQIHCPTNALDADYKLDARKCISYYTIEHRDTIPINYWKYLGKSIFGCDICQQVCPYNKKIEYNKNLDYLKIKSLPSLSQIALMSQPEYELFFSATPMTRAKRSGLRRNALIAMVVTKDKSLPLVLEKLKDCEDQVIQKTILNIPEYISYRQKQT